MKVGSVKEIKNNEYRVGMTPDNVRSYAQAGHQVLIEDGPASGLVLQPPSMKRLAQKYCLRQKKCGRVRT